MSTQIRGDFDITHVYLESRVRLIDEAMAFALPSPGRQVPSWRYTLSLASDTIRNSCSSYGRVLAADHQAPMLRAAELLTEGYVPGTVEGGLYDVLAT
jgi:hypothetical protein